jgi:hypothetical protein
MMTDVDYIITQERLRFIADLVTTINLDGFLQRIEEAEAIGPIAHPMLYIKAAAKLDGIKRIAEAARELQRVVNAEVVKKTFSNSK